MGGARRVTGPEVAVPWWVGFSRWLNGDRVCSVGDCVALTDPDEDHCPVHIRETRAALRGRRCAVDRCVDPRDGADTLCARHREEVLVWLACRGGVDGSATARATVHGSGRTPDRTPGRFAVPAVDPRRSVPVRRWNTG